MGVQTRARSTNVAGGPKVLTDDLLEGAQQAKLSDGPIGDFDDIAILDPSGLLELEQRQSGSSTRRRINATGKKPQPIAELKKDEDNVVQLLVHSRIKPTALLRYAAFTLGKDSDHVIARFNAPIRQKMTLHSTENHLCYKVSGNDAVNTQIKAAWDAIKDVGESPSLQLKFHTALCYREKKLFVIELPGERIAFGFETSPLGPELRYTEFRLSLRGRSTTKKTLQEMKKAAAPDFREDWGVFPTTKGNAFAPAEETLDSKAESIHNELLSVKTKHPDPKKRTADQSTRIQLLQDQQQELEQDLNILKSARDPSKKLVDLDVKVEIQVQPDRPGIVVIDSLTPAK